MRDLHLLIHATGRLSWCAGLARVRVTSVAAGTACRISSSVAAMRSRLSKRTPSHGTWRLLGGEAWCGELPCDSSSWVVHWDSQQLVWRPSGPSGSLLSPRVHWQDTRLVSWNEATTQARPGLGAGEQARSRVLLCCFIVCAGGIRHRSLAKMSSCS